MDLLIDLNYFVPGKSCQSPIKPAASIFCLIHLSCVCLEDLAFHAFHFSALNIDLGRTFLSHIPKFPSCQICAKYFISGLHSSFFFSQLSEKEYREQESLKLCVSNISTRSYGALEKNCLPWSLKPLCCDTLSLTTF